MSALENFPKAQLFEVVGGFLDKPIRTDPADDNFANIADLVAQRRSAATKGDPPAIGALASESARRNARRRKGPGLEGVEALAAELGAVGVVAAHTGSVRGLLFMPGSVPVDAEGRLRAIGLHQVLQFASGGRSC